jgi:hypothetical protein
VSRRETCPTCETYRTYRNGQAYCGCTVQPPADDGREREYEDNGPFTMSRYLKKEDLYAAMANRIERLERENKILALAASEHAKGNFEAFELLRAERDRMKAALEKIGSYDCDTCVEIAREALK